VAEDDDDDDDDDDRFFIKPSDMNVYTRVNKNPSA